MKISEKSKGTITEKWLKFPSSHSDQRNRLLNFTTAFFRGLKDLEAMLGRPEPCEGNLVAAASCGLMVKHPWPLLEISLSDFRRLATLNMITYLPTL